MESIDFNTALSEKSQEIYDLIIDQKLKIKDLTSKELSDRNLVIRLMKENKIKYKAHIIENLNPKLKTPKVLYEISSTIKEYSESFFSYRLKSIIANQIPNNSIGKIKKGKKDIVKYYDDDLVYKYYELGFGPIELLGKLNPEVFNDPKYMYKCIKDNIKLLELLGDKLSNNSEFFKLILSDKEIKDQKTKYLTMMSTKYNVKEPDKELVELLLEFMTNPKTNKIPQNIQLDLGKKISDEYLINSPEIEELFLEKGFNLHMLYQTDFADKRIDEIKRSELEKFINYLKTDAKNLEYIRAKFDEINKRGISFESLARIIQACPSLYEIISSDYKKCEKKNEYLISLNPELESIIKNDKGYLIEKEKRLNRLAKNREKKVKNDEAKKNALLNEYKILGKNHPHYQLVNEFENSNISIDVFLQKNNLAPVQFENIRKSVKDFFGEDKNNEIYNIEAEESQKEIFDVIKGNKTFFEYAKNKNDGISINTIIDELEDSNDKKIVNKEFLTSIKNREITMIEIKNLFVTNDFYYKHGIDKDNDSDNSWYDEKWSLMFKNIKVYLKKVSEDFPELQRDEILIIPAYEFVSKLFGLYKNKAYNENNFINTKIGFKKDDTSPLISYTITKDMLEFAKKYLKDNHEYLCSFSMNKVLSQMVKGEIPYDFDKIKEDEEYEHI